VSDGDAVAVILWAGVTLYAIFGGADFGGGFWDLTAGFDEKKGAPIRDLVDRSLTPVWEANHVWLIFVLVVLWTGFPKAFSAIMTTLYVPFAIAALGIVLRGSGFAFRHIVTSLAGRRTFGALFAISSVITPFCLGAVVGGIACGRVPAAGSGPAWSSWLNVTSIVVGALFVASGAYLAAVFLVHDARRDGLDDLAEAFTRRALGAAVASGALAVAGIFALHAHSRVIYDGLTGDAIWLVILSAVCGTAVVVTLVRRRGPPARPLAALAVAAVVAGWGVAQHPYLLPTSLTIDQGTGVASTTIFVVFVVALVVVVPSLGLLYVLQRRDLLGEGD
jgi:cytochrome d ubiquinol oxidase subunit II